MGCAASKGFAHGGTPEETPTATDEAQQPERPPDDDDDAAAELLAADAAALDAAIAEPLPESSEWANWGGTELEPLLACTDVIDAAWLLRLANGEVMPEANGVVPAWQQVPPEAKLSLATLRRTTMELKLPVAVLSYGWAAKHHPDPTGTLLSRLKPVLEAMVHSCEHGVIERFPDEKPTAWGIVWDFMSLPQRGYTTGYDAARDDRTTYQLQRFGKGLRSVNVWYGAVFTTTLVCDWPMPDGAENAAPIDRRGWCIFERRLSSVRKHNSCCLALSQLGERRGPYWDDLETACMAGRLPPQPPDAFESMLREGMAREEAAAGTGFRFTNGKDATAICIPQYREAFLRLMRAEGMLTFGSCAWADAQVAELAAALMYAHTNDATSQADNLALVSNELTDAAVPPLAAAITAGALPRLERLNLLHNQLGDAALSTLRPLLAGPLTGLTIFSFGARLTAEGARTLTALLADGHLNGLEELDLCDNCELGDAGAAAIAGALSAERLPALKELNLKGTGMGDTGARALAGALGGAPKLQTLVVGENAFGPAAKEELKAACAQRGIAAMASFFDALSA